MMDYEIELSDDFDFYLNEIIAPFTNDKDDMDNNSTPKFLFYHFTNLRLNLNEDTYKLRHTIVSGNQYILEVLQSRDCSCFINRLLEASEGDITSLNLREVDDN